MLAPPGQKKMITFIFLFVLRDRLQGWGDRIQDRGRRTERDGVINLKSEPKVKTIAAL